MDAVLQVMKDVFQLKIFIGPIVGVILVVAIILHEWRKSRSVEQ